MIIYSVRPAVAVGICFLAALLILVLENKIRENFREAITIGAALISAAIVLSMVPGAINGVWCEIQLWQIAEGIGFAFRADAAAMVFAIIASCLWILTSFYSIGYVRGHHERNQTGYFAAFAACIGSALGIAMAANLITFFIFYEMLTIATYPLVVHYRDEKARRSGRKYLIYTLVSGQLFFAAIVCVYAFCGTGDFKAGGFLSEVYAEGGLQGGMGIVLVLFLMMIGGGAVKAGVMPLHGWLPSAMVAPTPVSALLHAVAVVKAGAFCVLRVVCYVFGPELAAACGGAKLLSWLSVGTILLSSMIAIQKDNLKARLAFSTVGQLSYIVLGISLLSVYSISGALFHMAAHATLKITLFMAAGAILVTTGKSEISQMKGLVRQMPVTAVCFAAASLGIAGLPLMAGFVSKFNMMKGAVLMGKPFIALVYVAAALLAVAYLMPVVQIFFRKEIAGEGIEAITKDAKETAKAIAEDAEAVHEVSRKHALAMGIPMVMTLLLAVILGTAPNFGPHLYQMAQVAAEAVMKGG